MYILYPIIASFLSIKPKQNNVLTEENKTCIEQEKLCQCIWCVLSVWTFSETHGRSRILLSDEWSERKKYPV